MEKNENGYCVPVSVENIPKNHPSSLAMVYSLSQDFRMLYEPAKALERGTLFEELDKPLEEENLR